MPQKPFVMRVHFYLPGGESLHSLQSGAHHVAYMGSPDKGELLVDTRTSLESAAIHAKYAGEREGSLGYFGSMADRPQAAQQAILQAQGPVWRVIASVSEEDALKMGGALITKAGWDQAMQPVVAKMTTELGLDPQKVQWIAAVHRHQHHERNPHVHLLLWEQGEPSRKTGEWTKKELQTIRREAVSQLYRPERMQLGQAKTTVRAEIRETVKTLVTQPNGQQDFQQELTQRLQALGDMLPGKGRLAYAYMPEEVKAQVADTIRWLWTQDPALKMLHDRYLAAAEKMATFYWHVDPDKSQDVKGREAAIQKARHHAETDLIERLAAPVLKAARTEHKRTSREAYREASTAIRHFLRDDAQRERLQPWIDRLQVEGPTDDALKELVLASRTWTERSQWLQEWITSGEWSDQDQAAETGLRAWDTVVQSVVQGLARQAQREALQTAWEAALHDPDQPDIPDRLWTIAAQYVQSDRRHSDWQAALAAYAQALPALAREGGDLAWQKFARHLAHHVGWLDEEQQVDAVLSRNDFRRFLVEPEEVIRDLIARSPALQKAERVAGYRFLMPEPFTYRYAHQGSNGDWSFTTRTFREGSGPLWAVSFPENGASPAAPGTVVWPPQKEPPGIQASAWDPQKCAQDREAAQRAFQERVRAHIQHLGYARGVYGRHALTPNLHAALMRIMHQAERDAARTATWLAESQYQRQQAEIAIARNTGQDIAL